MIDPINPNQNQQNQAATVAPLQPQAAPHAQTPASAPAQDQQVFNSVNVGSSSAKPELGPITDSQFSENQNIEDEPTVEQSGEFSEPKVSEEIKDTIKVKKEFPDLDPDAKKAGVTETIPTGPVYGNFPANLQQAQDQYKEKPPSSSDKWRALEAIKNFGRNLLGQSTH